MVSLPTKQFRDSINIDTFSRAVVWSALLLQKSIQDNGAIKYRSPSAISVNTSPVTISGEVLGLTSIIIKLPYNKVNFQTKGLYVLPNLENYNNGDYSDYEYQIDPSEGVTQPLQVESNIVNTLEKYLCWACFKLAKENLPDVSRVTFKVLDNVTEPIFQINCLIYFDWLYYLENGNLVNAINPNIITNPIVNSEYFKAAIDTINTLKTTKVNKSGIVVTVLSVNKLFVSVSSTNLINNNIDVVISTFNTALAWIILNSGIDPSDYDLVDFNGSLPVNRITGLTVPTALSQLNNDSKYLKKINNQEASNSNGEITIDLDFVKTVNGNSPDTNGNINVSGNNSISNNDIIAATLTNFSEFDNRAVITATDTIFTALRKLYKFIQDMLTTFNTEDNLVKLVNGVIPSNLYTSGSGGGSGVTLLSNNNTLVVNKEYWNSTPNITVNVPMTGLSNYDIIKITNIVVTGTLTLQNTFDSQIISGLDINYLIYNSTNDNWKIYDKNYTLVKTLKNSNTGISLTYSNFLASNGTGGQGLFYYLGTNNNTTSWNNPNPSKVLITATGATGTLNSNLHVNRNLSDLTSSSNTNPSFITYQLLTEINFILKRYVIQWPINSSDKPLQWFIAGSNNGSNWTTLHTQNINYNWVSNNYNYLSPLLSDNITVYSHYKLQLIGLNSGNDYRFNIGEIEFYGEVV